MRGSEGQVIEEVTAAGKCSSANERVLDTSDESPLFDPCVKPISIPDSPIPEKIRKEENLKTKKKLFKSVIEEQRLGIMSCRFFCNGAPDTQPLHTLLPYREQFSRRIMLLQNLQSDMVRKEREASKTVLHFLKS